MHNNIAFLGYVLPYKPFLRQYMISTIDFGSYHDAQSNEILCRL